MTLPKLEPAVIADSTAIATILSDWIDETTWMPRVHTRAEDQQFGSFLIEKCDVTVARSAGDVVGFIALQDSDIQALYLRPDARGCGLGSRFLDHAKSASDRLWLWTFQANHAAQRFYVNNGFVENTRTDGQGNDEKLPDIHYMWKRDAT